MTHKVICIGAALVDELFYSTSHIIKGTSNPAIMKRSAGGVMLNIARHLALLNTPVQLITVLGNDPDGKWLKEDAERFGIDMSEAEIANYSSGKYTAFINPDGTLYTAACYNPAEEILNISFLEERRKNLSTATIILADTNLETASLKWLNDFCKEKNIMLIIETVSVAKAKKISSIELDGLFMLTPNEDELRSLSQKENASEKIIKELLQRGVKNIWLRKAEKGSVLYGDKKEIALHAASVIIKDITGAGDAALAGWVAAFCHEFSGEDCLKMGHALAAEVIQINGAIAPHFSFGQLKELVNKHYPE
ncbi:MAG: PfkB family carbohydrate kinase [Bacteroidota bacterium]